MMKYRITETAGPFVAGQRNPGAGTILALSARAAAHELRLGTLVAVEAKPTARQRRRAVAADPGPGDAGTDADMPLAD